MRLRSDTKQDVKISAQFEERLRRFGPGEKVRAIAILRLDMCDKPPDRWMSAIERKQAVERARASAGPKLAEIDRILAENDGRRLAEHADALGAVPVETTAAGVRALALCPHVKAILEDQPISLLEKPPPLGG